MFISPNRHPFRFQGLRSAGQEVTSNEICFTLIALSLLDSAPCRWGTLLSMHNNSPYPLPPETASFQNRPDFRSVTQFHIQEPSPSWKQRLDCPHLPVIVLCELTAAQIGKTYSTLFVAS